MSARNVVFLGNPTPHRPVTDGGVLVGHQPLENSQPDVTEIHLQEDMGERLIAHVEEIRAAASESFRARVREGALLGLHMEDWELACGHVLLVAAGHHHEGVSFASADHSALEEAIAALFGVEKAPPGTTDALKLAKLESDPARHQQILDGIPAHHPTALKTEVGVENIALSSFGTAAAPAPTNYFALTANAEAPKATNTTLAGEIKTAGGGLIRKQGTFSFVKATGVATLTTTFEANATDVLPVTIEKFGGFNKATEGGSMGLETKLSSSVAFKAEKDNMTLTETLAIT